MNPVVHQLGPALPQQLPMGHVVPAVHISAPLASFNQLNLSSLSSNPLSICNNLYPGLTPTVSGVSTMSSNSAMSLSPRRSVSNSLTPPQRSHGDMNYERSRARVASYSDLMQGRRRQRTPRYIVIFDWDDTLFPTSTIVHDEEACATTTAQELHRYGKALYEMLEHYISVFGHQNVFIVTNGDQNWVMRSIKDMSDIYQQKVLLADKEQSQDTVTSVVSTTVSTTVSDQEPADESFPCLTESSPSSQTVSSTVKSQSSTSSLADDDFFA